MREQVGLEWFVTEASPEAGARRAPGQLDADYTPRHAAFCMNKLRAKQLDHQDRTFALLRARSVSTTASLSTLRMSRMSARVIGCS